MSDQAAVIYRERGLSAPFAETEAAVIRRFEQSPPTHFLMENFGGYTAQAGNIFGYWRSGAGEDSCGEQREFSVGVRDESKVGLLKDFLAKFARGLHVRRV